MSTHFKDSQSKDFYAAIDTCVSQSTYNESQILGETITNAVAEACVEKVAVPSELQFAFDYGVDCNKFHNGLVDKASQTKPVSTANWTTCRKVLAQHFTDSDAVGFYSEIDSCVTTGNSVALLSASSNTNKMANDCVSKVSVPKEV